MQSGENVELIPHGSPRDVSGMIGDARMGEPEGVPWARYLDALKRHAPLIIAIVMTGSALGFLAARRVKSVYDVQSTVWIASGLSPQSGPIRPQQLLPPASWIELLRSYSIVEQVVRNLRLNVSHRPADSVFFRGFESLPSLRPGKYLLQQEQGGRYVLSDENKVSIERGTLGDSIGRKVGFGWAPDARLFTPGRILNFSVSTPRSTAVGLLTSLHSSLPEDGQFLTITLSGSDPARTARTLNAWVEQFVASSGDLKKRHLLVFKKTLADQLGVAENQLRSSEAQLERFRVSTITLPSGGSAAQGADPSVVGYFQQKGTLGEVQSERMTLERLVADAGSQTMPFVTSFM